MNSPDRILKLVVESGLLEKLIGLGNREREWGTKLYGKGELDSVALAGVGVHRG